jgi:hypothetical protein
MRRGLGERERGNRACAKKMSSSETIFRRVFVVAGYIVASCWKRRRNRSAEGVRLMPAGDKVEGKSLLCFCAAGIKKRITYSTRIGCSASHRETAGRRPRGAVKQALKNKREVQNRITACVRTVFPTSACVPSNAYTSSGERSKRTLQCGWGGRKGAGEVLTEGR